MRKIAVFVITFLFVFSSLVSQASAVPVKNAHMEVDLISELETVVPGGTFWVGVTLKPDEHWHTYWQSIKGTLEDILFSCTRD